MKTRRNEPCPCGSGRKYKHCCLLHEKAHPETVDQVARPKPRSKRDEISAVQDLINEMPERGMSPEYWDELERRIPAGMRKEFMPMIRKMKASIADEGPHSEIASAHDALEKYRRKYERLARNPHKLLLRAEKVFAEPRFESMRFTADDLQRAFKKVGYPPMGPADDAFVEIVNKTVAFLVNNKKRTELTRRLLSMLPDYVEAGRHMDAWIIQHSAMITSEPTDDGCGPFLLCMFMHGMREWEEQMVREQLDMFRSLGIDPDVIRKKGVAGYESLVREMREDKTAEVEEFLIRHPALKEQMETRARESEDAAVRLLLTRKNAHSLLISGDELVPWLSILVERISGIPGVLDALQQKSNLSKGAEEKVVKLMFATCSEMAEAVFTPSRLEQLTTSIHAYRRRLSRRDQEGMMGVNGALVMSQSSAPPKDNYFLTMLCRTSLISAMGEMYIGEESP